VDTQLQLLAVLVALLVGLGVGKGWERYKLTDGRLLDRRRLRETPHYMLGLNFLVDQQVDQAIDELTQAASGDGHSLELQMILGNLYRQKGQVSRAITIHQALLKRPRLSTLEHAYVLLCLGLDFRHGGFVDRASEAFREVLRLDPRNRHALLSLQRLHEEQHQWREAVEVRSRIAALDERNHLESQPILGFLRNEIGLQREAEGDVDGATRSFEEAIDVAAATTPAYLHLGDIHARQGRLAEAIAAWERLVNASPDRAHLAFERLEQAFYARGVPHRFVELCQRHINRNPREWRARLALSRHLSAQDQPERALEVLLEALPHHPHGLAIHQEIWQVLSMLGLAPGLVQRYRDLAREAVFYLDPHICTRCRYRSTALLWQCPQCHGWNTFVEERTTPAKDVIAELVRESE